MGGGDLNMKKSWHPLLHSNQERVWKQEKKAYEERKKLDELRRERDQEREMQELQRLQEEAGGKKKVDKVDWMYATPSAGGGPSATELEDYLLGKKSVDQFINKKAKEATQKDLAAGPGGSKEAFMAIQQNANSAGDMAAKIREDPMFAIKQQEQAAYQALLKDPTRLRQMRAAAGLQDEDSKDDKRKRKEQRRAKREERDRRHDRHREGSGHRYDEDDYDRHYSREGNLRNRDRHNRSPDGRYSRGEYSGSRRYRDGGDRERSRHESPDRRATYSDRRPQDSRDNDRHARRSDSRRRESRSPDHSDRRQSHYGEEQRRRADRDGWRNSSPGDRRRPSPRLHDERQYSRRSRSRSPVRNTSHTVQSRLDQERQEYYARRPPSPPRTDRRAVHDRGADPPRNNKSSLDGTKDDGEAARAAALARMQSNAAALNSHRTAYLDRVKQEEEEEERKEDAIRARRQAEAAKSGPTNGGSASISAAFLSQQRSQGLLGGDLEERLKRTGRGGLQRLDGAD